MQTVDGDVLALKHFMQNSEMSKVEDEYSSCGKVFVPYPLPHTYKGSDRENDDGVAYFVVLLRLDHSIVAARTIMALHQLAAQAPSAAALL